MAKKSTRAVTEERILIVMDMILSGYTRREILYNTIQNDKLRWEVSKNQIIQYHTAAQKEILLSYEADKDKITKDIFTKYKQLYKKSVSTKNFSNARAVLNDMADLTGIKAPAKHDHTTGGEKFNTIIIQPFGTAVLPQSEADVDTSRNGAENP